MLGVPWRFAAVFQCALLTLLASKWIYQNLISYIWTAEKDMNLWLIIADTNTTWAVVKLKPKKFRPERDSTHDLCNTWTQLNYQVIWELVTLWVLNIPVESEDCKWIHEISYILTAEKDMNLWLIITVIHTTWALTEAWIFFRLLISQLLIPLCTETV